VADADEAVTDAFFFPTLFACCLFARALFRYNVLSFSPFLPVALTPFLPAPFSGTRCRATSGRQSPGLSGASNGFHARRALYGAQSPKGWIIKTTLFSHPRYTRAQELHFLFPVPN
jgi:hypothetical protein